MKSWKLFVDDECFTISARSCPKGFIPATNSKNALLCVLQNDMPEVMDLDHDLGMLDGKKDEIKDFLNALSEYYLDVSGNLCAPPALVIIHSMNNTAFEWIRDFWASWCKISGHEMPDIQRRNIL